MRTLRYDESGCIVKKINKDAIECNNCLRSHPESNGQVQAMSMFDYDNGNCIGYMPIKEKPFGIEYYSDIQSNQVKYFKTADERDVYLHQHHIDNFYLI